MPTFSAPANARSHAPRFPRAVDRGFVLVLAVAILARVIALVQARTAPFWSTPIMDEAAYMRLADAMVRGLPPPHGAYYQAPGYGYFLASLHALGGGVVTVKLVQLAMGVVNSVLVWSLARRCFGAREAALAGMLWAVYPIALFHEVLLLKPTLAVMLSLLALVTLPGWPARDAPAANGPARPRSLLLGGAASGFFLGCAAVTQAEIAGVAAVIGLIALARSLRKPPPDSGSRAGRAGRRASPTGSWAAGSAGVAAFLLVLAVPTFQNVARGGGFVIVAYGGGVNFYIGNHSGADGSYVPLRPFRSDPTLEEADAVALAASAPGRTPRPGEVSREWWRRGLAWWREQPAAAARLTLAKLALLWGPQEQADVLDSGIAARWMGILRNPIVHPRVLLPVALVGLWLARRRRDLWAPRGFVLGSTLMIVPFFVFERFRMPMTAVCLPFAAHAAIRLWDTLRARRLAPAVGGVLAAVALAAALGFAHVPRERAVMRANVGNMFLLRGRYDEALAEFEAVLAARPAAWRVEIGIATAQAGLGRTDAALRTLGSVLGRLRAEARATGRTPAEELVMCLALAGDLELESGRPLAAAANYREALELAPGHPTLTSRLAAADGATRRPASAEAPAGVR